MRVRLSGVNHRPHLDAAVQAAPRRPALRLEREVLASGEVALRGFAARRRDDQLVRPEKAVTGAADRNPEDVEDGRVEPPRSRKVAHDQLDVVDQPAAVKLVHFHANLLFAVP